MWGMNGSEFKKFGEQTPSLGTGEGEVPLASTPSPKIDVRTMASDLNSTQESGGGAPRPYTPPPSAPPVSPAAEPEKEPVFKPSEISAVQGTGQMAQIPISSRKKSSKTLVWAIVIALIVIGLAALGYFVIYPILTTEPEITVPPPPPPSPVEIPTSTPTTTIELPPPPEAYISLFKTILATTTETTLSGFLGLTDVKTSLNAPTSTTPAIKEVVWRDDQGKLLTFGQLTSLLIPQVLSTTTADMFISNFSAFVYSDSRGAWPGYVFKLKPDAVTAAAQANFKSEFEKASALTLENLFLTIPGTPQTWRQGKTGTITHYYLVFPTLNTSLTYALVGDKLIVSTSYDGFKEALKNL